MTTAPRTLLSITEYATAHGVTRQAVHQRIQRGTLPAIRLGRAWFIVTTTTETT